MKTLEQAIRNISPLDRTAMDGARKRQAQLTKPAGSLGRLEEISIRLAGIQALPIPHIKRKVIVTAAGDHGVAKQGVSAYPQEVTAQMVINFLHGGAAINVLAKHVGAELQLVDAGIVGNVPNDERLLRRGMARGTNDFTHGPAMSVEQATGLLEAGIEHGAQLARGGGAVIGLGDMGIANTTASSAIIACMTRSKIGDVTGRGTGVDDAQLTQKVATIEKALLANRPDPRNGFDVLQKIGGFEIAYLAGVSLGAASERGAVVLDGLISTAAGLIAHTIWSDVSQYMFASHKSVEAGHIVALKHLGLTPLIDLDMRLGEGTGAALGISIIEAAALCLSDMATFGEAGVSEKDAKP